MGIRRMAIDGAVVTAAAFAAYGVVLWVFLYLAGILAG